LSVIDQRIAVRAHPAKVLLPALLSFVGTLIALYPNNPNIATLPSRDSGVFLYVGWRLLNGDVPYRDVWDHKPPLIYFVDALGLLFTPQSLWGVWILQFLFLFLTVLLLYKALEKAFGLIPALAGTVILTSGLLTILEQGNVTEEYALVFQALCFFLFLGAQKNNYPLRTTFWIGLCGGFAFYFKQTTIGVWLAYGLLLTWIRISQKKSPLADLLALLAGWGILSVILASIFASQNALSDYWSESFLYNFAYINKHEGYSRLIPVFVKGFIFLDQGAVLPLAVGGWLAGLVYAGVHRKSILKRVPHLILLALINFPLEVALITVSGRSILHYYLTPLPVMAALSGILVYVSGDLSAKIQIQKVSPAQIKNSVSVIALAVILFLQVNQVVNYPADISEMAQNSYAPVIDYVASHTNPNDRVLIIGAESVVNFLARREAPTRYVYQYPLQLLGRRDMFEEYFRDIMKNRPVLVIDAPGSSPINNQLYAPLQQRSPLVREGVQYLINNYQVAATFGDWTIYRIKTNP
jgi:4-amino-4-deoxy-L-arabinose transferase-like glycosyltransferase